MCSYVHRANQHDLCLQCNKRASVRILPQIQQNIVCCMMIKKPTFSIKLKLLCVLHLHNVKENNLQLLILYNLEMKL